MDTVTTQNRDESQLENLENLYELSPMQQGMLFHSIYSPNSGDYFEQSLFTINGDLNVAAFEDAWQLVLERHPILRTSFLWEDLEKPLQVVYRQVNLPLAKHDWRNLPAEEQAHELESFIKEDRNQDFLLSNAPLIRLALFRLKDEEYKFLFSRHHVVLDRWSRSLLLKDLFAAYHALSEGKEPSLKVTRPYVDYISWLGKQDANAAERFWRNSLAGFTEPTSLEIGGKTDHGVDGTERYSEQRIQLSEEITAKLSEFARQHRLTLNTVVQGAWALLLSRYTGKDDVVFGATVAGRPAELAGVESMVGLFINTLPVRVRMPASMRVLPWLKELQAQQGELQQFEYSSLLDIQGWSDVPRGVPMFESILVFENLPVGSSYQAANNGVEFRDDRGVGSTTGYPLTLYVNPGRRLAVKMVYDLTRYTDDAVRNLLTHFQAVFENLPSAGDTAISSVPLLTESEQKQILIDWNNTQTDFERRGNVVKLFEHQASSTPSATAISCQHQQLTYAELNARANQLAKHLRSSGVGPETVVGICLDRSLEMVVGLLGILKASAAYLPLDPELPKERLAFMMEDAGVRAVVTESRLSKELPLHQAKIVAVDEDHEDISSQTTENLDSAVIDESLAYVIYTSGSTGKPKGVQVSHAALANFLNSMRRRPGISNSDVLLSVTTLSFDIAGLELYLPLTVGARLVVARRNETSDGEALARLISQSGATLMQGTPATWRLLIESGWKGEAKLRILCGGEALPKDLATQLLERGAELWNLYGPTETTIWSTLKQISAPVDEITIGKPIANTQIYILDQQLQPVPIGVAGELHIGGEGVARGYLNQPELTAEKFVPDPWAAGQRLYKTGDLARYRADGNIEYIGRLDDQVKIRGFRIELGEIETVLREHGSVRNVVVVEREGKLVAYVVATEEQSSDRAKLWSELRNLIKSRLPEYMLPAIFVELDALPLTSSGKVDRRKLPTPDQARPDLQQAYVAPRDRVEEQLATLWAHLLKLKSVGVHDNFFELGGHSLLAARLFAQIENRFGKHVPLATLFQSPTIEQLATVLRDSRERSWSSLVAIQPEGSRQRLFCIHAAGANVLIYRPLSRHLGNEQPVYALQAQGLDGSQPLKTVEEMAAHYIKEMRVFQPEGPYHLLGASFGGLVIYEMAYQLSRQNQKVGLVGMLNTNCPVYTLGKRIASHVVHLREHGPRYYGSAVIKGLTRRINRYVPVPTSGPSGNGLPRELEIRQVLEADRDRDEALVRTVSAILRAEEVYDPTGRLYPGKVTLFRAIDTKQDFHDNRLGWRNLAQGGVEVYDVPGTHTSMREEPNVAVLVEKLKPCLEKVQLTDD